MCIYIYIHNIYIYIYISLSLYIYIYTPSPALGHFSRTQLWDFYLSYASTFYMCI